MSDKYLPLTAAEKAVVENNLLLVEKVVKRHISINKSVNGLGYDDLIQEGSIGLCAAAKTYNGSVLFETYASKVIRNHLIDHCRSALRANKHMIFTDDERGIEIVDTPIEDNMISLVADIDVNRLLSDSKLKYSGCVLKGIEALELKISGYSGTEIAAVYGVKPNLVGAWISKAVKRLRNDDNFINDLKDCG
jgi:RNA polymerase sigma factor (sigma-70 family)